MAKPTLVTRVLAWRPVVFIGLISYSLYLWHWPLLVFAKYGRQEPAGSELRLTLLLASFAIAVVSWRWVETPFRRRQYCPQRWQVYSLAGCGIATLLALGTGVCLLHGLPSRLPAQAQTILKASQKSFIKITSPWRRPPMASLPRWVRPVPTSRRPSCCGATATPWGCPRRLKCFAGNIPCGARKRRIYVFLPWLATTLRTVCRALKMRPSRKPPLNISHKITLKQWLLRPIGRCMVGLATLEPCLVRTVQTIRATGASVFVLKDVPGTAVLCSRCGGGHHFA